MKATGIVRKLDQLGRVVMPIEARRTRGIIQGDLMEIFVDGDRIVLEKFAPMCVFCGSRKDVGEHKGKNICNVCRGELVQI